MMVRAVPWIPLALQHRRREREGALEGRPRQWESNKRVPGGGEFVRSGTLVGGQVYLSREDKNGGIQEGGLHERPVA